jgi:recombination protein RecA
LPVGRIVELHGLESTGKSLICAHIIANTQKMGGKAVFIDTENAAAPEFWKAVGVDIKEMGYATLFTVEEVFSKIEEVIGAVRKTNGDVLLTIVVDSLSQASCETEMESKHGKDGYNTSKAIIISKACRKITGLIGRQRVLIVFTNQLRMNLNAVKFGDKWIVPGGKAMAFASSVRVRLGNTGALKKGNKIIGNNCKAVVTKNRMGPPKRSALFEIHFDSGIQDLKSWLDFMKECGIAKKVDDKYNIKLPSDTIKVTVPEFVEKINTDQKFKDEVYDAIANEYIMKYRDPNSQIQEDVEVDENAEED